ncbi:hypothetical protein PENNAL_c0325G00318, partial [Penicillium nalgiovense]
MSDNTLSAFSSSRVTLKDSSNWELWISTIKTVAEQFEVWELCDPEKDTEPALPEEPIEPDWEELQREYPRDWFHVYGVKNAQYERQYNAYKKKLQGRKVVANAIRQTIHEKYQVFIDQETPWGLLRNLRQRLSPECNPTYKASLRAAWRNLDRGLDKSTDIEQWLLNWQTLQKRCAKAGITEAREASIQFLEAIAVISPEFHSSWVTSAEIACASEKNEEERQADFGNLLTRYKAHWLITHGRQQAQKGVSKAVFSTWQGHQEAQPGDAPASKSVSKSSAKKSSDLPVEKRNCPCSKLRHRPWKCWAVYSEDRPDDIPAPNPERKKAWDKAMKADPEWKAYVEKKRAEMKSASNETQANPVFQGRELGFFSMASVSSQQRQQVSSQQRQQVSSQQRQQASSQQRQQTSSASQTGELNFFLAEAPLSTNDQEHSVIDHHHSMIHHDYSVIHHDHSMFQKSSSEPISDRWLVDTGAQIHICNNLSLFIEFRKTDSSIRVGDTETMVEGIGTVSILGVSPGNEAPRRMNLFNVRYSPGFHTNIIAHGLMFRKTGAVSNFKKNWIEQGDIPMYATYQEWDLPWLIKSDQPLVNAAVKKSAREPASEASIEIWHRRLGHVSKERIEKLTEMTEGVHIAGGNPGKQDAASENQVCEACQLANAPRQISRRKIGQAYGVLGRVHFDLVQNQPAYNRHVWLTHFYLDGIRCHFVFTHVKKNDCQWAVRKFIALIRNWLNVKIKVFHYDNERSAGNEVENMIEAEGCIIEHSPPETPEMNGPAERSGGVIIQMARVLINENPDLPKTLWPEAVYTSAYILNRMPTKLADGRWIIPWMELMKLAAPDGIKDQRINLSNLRVYSCLAYTRILDSKRTQSDKMSPRAEIGFLVGYVSKNLYRIWFPHKGGQYGRVDVVRDAIFDETRRYTTAKKLESEDAVSTLTNTLEERENWPTILTWDEAQSELSTQMQMPPSIARIALHDDVQHTQQGQNPHTDRLQDADLQDAEMQYEDAEMQDAEMQDADLVDGEMQEREMQSERIGRQQTPIAIQKPSDNMPITPASIRPTQQTANRGYMPGSFPANLSSPPSPTLPASHTMQNQPFSSERTPFSSSPAPDTPVSASQTPRSMHTDAADADPEHASDDKVRDNGTQSESKVRDNSLPEPVPTSAIQPAIPSVETGGVEYEDEISESEMQLQQELTQAPVLHTEPARARRDRSDGINTTNIISGSRSRKPRQDPDYAAYLTMEEDEPPALVHAFGACINERFESEQKPKKPHREQLPPEPQNWNEVKSHLYAREFIAAAKFEIETLRRKETFSQVPMPNTRTTQILPLKWVFTYKFDADGVLDKFKARICVRGDLQWMTPEEKRAATLAVKTARAVFALVAAFDLDMTQRDVVNAFLNSILQDEIYTRCPPGFEASGRCWMLHRALYGLRMSPRLWQQEATRVLVKLGLTPIPEDPCIFVMNGIIVFFYVDDIIIVNHPDYAEQADQLDDQMKKHWELREFDASWFLNIRIVRDRTNKKLWLCQDSYIESMAARYGLITNRRVDTPLSIEPLLPFDGIATASQIHGFQAKVGSAQYATTITRPDAAKATSKLAEFLLNPGPKHLDAIDRVIQYLYQTRYYAIEYGAQMKDENSSLQLVAKSIEFASDASFGDNRDRKSSEGYICKLYGGPIDWKASKQKTITTSTTEAELLALSEAGKTIQWWRRVLESLGFKPSHPLSIACDNQQTVDLLTKEGATMHTKLRHVDINRLWMKQEVHAGRTN